MTFISRILGFVRDALVAQMFGATAAVDAFYVAFKIPNFMRNLFAEGCFSQAFVPVLADYRTTKPEEVKPFISHIAGGLGLFLFILTIAGMVLAPFIVMLFAPGYHLGSERHIWATDMLRVTFPYLMLISLAALASAILNSYKHFAAAAFTPALLNICLIATAIFLSPHLAIPIESQSWGVLFAGFVQLGFLVATLWRYRLLVKPKIHFGDPGVNRVLKLMGPALLGASVGQISLLINTIFASFLIVGSVSWLYYSERLVFFPLGVFGVALATVVLPHLSAKHAAKSAQDYAKALDWGIRCNLIIALPAMVCLIVLAGPFIISLFGYGHFTAYDAVMTRKSVLAYSFGLPAFMLVKVLGAAFYAKQDTKTPVKISVKAIIANMILNAVLVFPLKHAGLALAASLGSWLNVAMLLYALKKQNIFHFEKHWLWFACQMIIANLVIGVTLYFLAGDYLAWLNHHFMWRFLKILELGAVGIVVYFGTLRLMGMRWKDYRIEHD
ncbi:MAG: mviN [Gammaproteobacteria bacterium]|nr:mviN [Gammaproteobacteria bacterium]